MKTVHVTYLLSVIAYFSFHDLFSQYEHPVVSGGHTKKRHFVDPMAPLHFGRRTRGTDSDSDPIPVIGS